MYSQDGYKLIRAEQLAGALAAFSNRQITFRAFRAFAGCLELLAIREAAERSAPANRKQRQRRFRKMELEVLLRLPDGVSVSRELFRLKEARLLQFSETAIELAAGMFDSAELRHLVGSRGGKRLIPVPRQMLRFLARCTRPALAKTIVAYLLRGLALDGSGRIKSAGTVKISWICRACRISERAAQSARAELIQLGWITKDTGSFQRKLNRDGAYFVIDPFWRRVPSAPRAPIKCTRSAPLREKQETPSGSKNQKPAIADSGVQVERSRPPNLRDIQPEDLCKPERLEKLYHQAVAAGWITHSESNVRNFICAALRATRSGGRAGPIFVGIVRKQLWHHITQEQENRALAVLKHFRQSHPRGFGLGDERNAELDELVLKLVGSALANSFQVRPPGRTPLQVEADARRKLLAQILEEGRGQSR